MHAPTEFGSNVGLQFVEIDDRGRNVLHQAVELNDRIPVLGEFLSVELGVGLGQPRHAHLRFVAGDSQLVMLVGDLVTLEGPHEHVVGATLTTREGEGFALTQRRHQSSTESTELGGVLLGHTHLTERGVETGAVGAHAVIGDDDGAVDHVDDHEDSGCVGIDAVLHHLDEGQGQARVGARDRHEDVASVEVDHAVGGLDGGGAHRCLLSWSRARSLHSALMRLLPSKISFPAYSRSLLRVAGEI